jgi:hypothetical protein
VNHEIHNLATHHRLQMDLIEHMWAQCGNNESLAISYLFICFYLRVNYVVYLPIDYLNLIDLKLQYYFLFKLVGFVQNE